VERVVRMLVLFDIRKCIPCWFVVVLPQPCLHSKAMLELSQVWNA